MAIEIISDADARRLEEQLDPEISFRKLARAPSLLVGSLLLALSCFHYYTAGFGLLEETTHRGVHLAFVIGLIFLVFTFVPAWGRNVRPSTGLAPGGIALFDWLLCIAAVVSALYVPWVFHDLADRVGNPSTTRCGDGLDHGRGAAGGDAPVDRLGPADHRHRSRSSTRCSAPGSPASSCIPGSSWSNLVNHLYLTSQGIYGVALGVVATYVFHFVLFGVLATKIGLGRLFLDVAAAVAGRFAGGPAKVSIFGSALFGMISGSSVANTVTVGSLTIPMMIRLGYQRHFAAAVEIDGCDRRPDHAADHGRGRLPDGRVPQHALRDDRHRGDRAGVHAFLRRVRARSTSKRRGPACAA